uniref:Uncharacterized protein n=1 Tax=Glossina pallidipes TaxID=7398 RepID=A0A1A9ZM28_GLOPL
MTCYIDEIILLKVVIAPTALLNCHTLNNLIERLDTNANVRTVIAEIRTPSKNALETIKSIRSVIPFFPIFNFIKSPLKSLKQTMEPVKSGIRYISTSSHNVESHILPFAAMNRVVLHASVWPTRI